MRECSKVEPGSCEGSPGSDITMNTNVPLDGDNEDFETLDHVPPERASILDALERKSVHAYKGNPAVHDKKKNGDYSSAVQYGHDFLADQQRASCS